MYYCGNMPQISLDAIVCLLALRSKLVIEKNVMVISVNYDPQKLISWNDRYVNVFPESDRNKMYLFTTV